ncbi:LuxR C-terminal-related transcriptional regulator [Geminocystis sp. CENA526]|uniref:LuxR C-terminal-related transcriptional regulator n=1 Tax=Geminocystis sp. CENA526 TaxID=1355871 RepID=UPI003D701453
MNNIEYLIDINSNKKQLVFLVVEDHPEVGENNCKYLQEISPSATCILSENPTQARNVLKKQAVDLIILDLQFGNVSGVNSARDGLDFLQFLFVEYPYLNILVYTSDPSLLKNELSLIHNYQGGFVVVNKIERRSSFIEGVKLALDGGFKIPYELKHELILTPKELYILQLICQESLTDKAIAQRINVSLKTIQNYVQKLKIKLNVNPSEETSSRVALCVEVLRRKLISF